MRAARVFAVTGALAFAASLGYFAYVYLVRLAVPAPETAPLGRGLAINLGLFTLFACHHSLLARSGAKRWVTDRLPAGLERTAYIWVASLLFAATCAGWQPLPGVVYQATGVGQLAGHAAQLAGMGLTLWGAAVLDPLELAGLRQLDPTWSATGTTPPVLRVRGPYRWVRHPIYLGWVLLVAGAPAMTASRLSFVLISIVYVVAALPWEERSMVDTFGDPYRRYRTAVPWRLIPGVY